MAAETKRDDLIRGLYTSSPYQPQQTHALCTLCTHIATLLRAPCDHMEMFMTSAPFKKGCEIRITCHSLAQQPHDVLG